MGACLGLHAKDLLQLCCSEGDFSARVDDSKNSHILAMDVNL